MSRYRSGPSPLIVILVGALFVFGGYYIWTGFLSFLEDEGNITAQVTREAQASVTAQAAPAVQLPTLYMPATFTPLPPCQWFEVSVDRAVYRDCPSTDNIQCPIRDVVTYGTQLCIYARAPGNPEWYVVELNPGGAFRDTVFIHESVVEAINPTPTITVTFTPLPTVSPVPSNTPGPTSPASPTLTPSETPTLTPEPRSSSTPVPMPTPVPTIPQIEL